MITTRIRIALVTAALALLAGLGASATNSIHSPHRSADPCGFAVCGGGAYEWSEPPPPVN